MASYFGVNSDYSSSFFSSMLGTSSSASNSFSALSSLGDYGLIKSGVYRKLMTAYYEKNDTSKTASNQKADTDKTTTKVQTDAANVNLSTAKGDAEKLKTATDTMKKVDTGDKDKVATGLKAFVSAYNSVIDSAQDTDNKYIAQKGEFLSDAMKQNESLLKSLGITKGIEDNLVFDESKMKAMDDTKLRTTISSLFDGRGSLGDQINTKANQIMSLASASIYTNNHQLSSYTNQGSYSSVNTSTLYNSLF